MNKLTLSLGIALLSVVTQPIHAGNAWEDQGKFCCFSEVHKKNEFTNDADDVFWIDEEVTDTFNDESVIELQVLVESLASKYTSHPFLL